MLNASEYIIL